MVLVTQQSIQRERLQPRSLQIQTYPAGPQQYINWSFGLQRQVPYNFTLGATYSGSQGHFPSRYTAVGPYNNSMDPKYLSLGSLLTLQYSPATLAQVQAVFPQVTLPFPNFKGTIAAMLEPYPQYASAINSGTGTGGTTCYSCDHASSRDNVMQVTVDRKLAQGSTDTDRLYLRQRDRQHKRYRQPVGRCRWWNSQPLQSAVGSRSRGNRPS